MVFGERDPEIPFAGVAGIRAARKDNRHPTERHVMAIAFFA
jgi:hypothetical protein